jgi:outer membrane protein OmpA-like peptidoglycan-associated protein
MLMALCGLPQAVNAQERYYIIYFRWNSTSVHPTMQRRVIEAAMTARQLGSTRIDVVGHTDTSMSDAQSMEISLRMAMAVADELVKNGVAGDTISLAATGETNLFKPTADGVIEPYNRRVEVYIR